MVIDQKPLTDRQREAFDIVVRHIRAEGRPPSIREVMCEMGMKSPNGAVNLLKPLAKKGWISTGGGRQRSIRVLAGSQCRGCGGLGRADIPESPGNLTARQREAFDAIVAHVLLTATPPTLREVGAVMGVTSAKGMMSHFEALRKKGWIEVAALDPEQLRISPRGIRITVGRVCPTCEGLGRELDPS
jgi:SOS-response transcriptional repressor LexA